MTQPWSGNWQLALFTLHWFSLKLDLTPSCQISHIWHLLLRIKIKVDTFFSELTQDQQTFLIAISWWQIWKGEKVEVLHIWTPPLFCDKIESPDLLKKIHFFFCLQIWCSLGPSLQHQSAQCWSLSVRGEWSPWSSWPPWWSLWSQW